MPTEAFLNEAPRKSLFLFKKKKKSSLDEWNVIQSSCTQPPLEKAFLGLRLHFTAPNSTCLSRPLTGLQEVGGKLYRVCPVNQKNEPASAPAKIPRSPGGSASLHLKLQLCSATAQCQCCLGHVGAFKHTRVRTPIAHAHNRPPQGLLHGLGISACHAGTLAEVCLHFGPTPILADWRLSASL